jgi:hypothetical protein
MISPSDPRIAARIRERHADALAAGYEDPIWGALVITIMAEIGIEDEAPRCRHPEGRGLGR